MPVISPIGVTKFMGASVTNIQSNAGWQEQVSALKVDLVEDLEDGDSFETPLVGTPASFIFEGFRFDGLVQRYARTQSTSINPGYTVDLHSPVEVLEAVQVILETYRGVNLICPNLLNVFGYLEGTDLTHFGGSGKNGSGIAWYKIANAITKIQLGKTVFSPGISLRGHTYYFDVSSMPQNIPDFYRVGAGLSASLMELIRTVCQDAGHDFLVCLQMMNGTGPHRIYLKTHSRLVQQPLGQIDAFIDGRDDIVSVNSGAEFRNDVTSGVIFGGDIEEIIPQIDPGNGQTIFPFWGFQNQPLLVPYGIVGNQPVVTSSGQPGNFYTVNFDASEIADIIGDGSTIPIYQCTVFEMRMALHSQDSWQAFMARQRPEIAKLLGLQVFPSILGNDQILDPNPQSLYTTSAESLGALTNNYATQPPLILLQRIYEFVKGKAEEYMGKKFLVRLPTFLKAAFEEETTNILYNVSINPDGYWPDYLGGWNTGPLGLNYENFNKFMNDSGKFQPFVKFAGPDLQYANPNTISSQAVVQNDGIYYPVNVDPQIVFAPQPCALVTLPDALWSYPADPVGGVTEIAWLLGISTDQLIQMLDIRHGEFPIKIHPWVFGPAGAAVCLHSHEFCYGPWSKIGKAGAVKVEQNQGLVPWNYGGFTVMNTAAQAQLAEIGAVNQEEESGDLMVPRAPEISLGDRLAGAGPVITSIDVSIGENGITTTYRMRSQTTVYGAFSKQNAERLRRLGTAAQDMRRMMRGLLDRMKVTQKIINQAGWRFLRNASKAVTMQGSNNVLQSFLVEDPVTGNQTAHVGSHDFGASLGGVNAFDDKKYQLVGSVGWEGIFRPFSTNPAETKLPHYETPFVVNTVTNTSLDHFTSDSDILWSSKGKQFRGQNPKTRTTNPDPTKDDDSMRPLTLRGPMVLVGWGKELTGRPVPNKKADAIPPKQGQSDVMPEVERTTAPTILPVDQPVQDWSSDYLDNYKNKFGKWKVGAVDLRWDKWRKVWSFPTILVGTYNIAAGDSTNFGTVLIRGTDINGNPIKDTLSVEKFLGGNFTDGQKVVCAYDPLSDHWILIGAACSS